MTLLPDLFSFAYVPSWYCQLDELAELARPEPWRFREPIYSTKNQDTPILERYIHAIFKKQAIDFNEEKNPEKAVQYFHVENEYACFHTGLYTEYYPPWEPPVSRFRAIRKWYFPPSEPPQHIVAAPIFDFTINLLIVILGELLMQYHQIIYREVFLCLRRQKSEVFWNFWEKI